MAIKKAYDPEEKEKFQKYLEELTKKAFLNAPLKYNYQAFWNELEDSKPLIPFEQDENGFYGYKTLVRIPGSQWFWSPNRYHNSEWVDNQLIAHVSPQRHPEYGIYATKDLESLKEWHDVYTREFTLPVSSIYRIPARTYIVKIRVWGCVVEHTTGFRAECAEIMEVLS